MSWVRSPPGLPSNFSDRRKKERPFRLPLLRCGYLPDLRRGCGTLTATTAWTTRSCAAEDEEAKDGEHDDHCAEKKELRRRAAGRVAGGVGHDLNPFLGVCGGNRADDRSFLLRADHSASGAAAGGNPDSKVLRSATTGGVKSGTKLCPRLVSPAQAALRRASSAPMPITGAPISTFRRTHGAGRREGGDGAERRLKSMRSTGARSAPMAASPWPRRS